LTGGADYQKSLDTIKYKSYNFCYEPATTIINYDVIIQALYVKPGATFNVTNTERSQSHLMSFKTYRLVNIRYSDYYGNSLNPGDTSVLGLFYPADTDEQAIIYGGKWKELIPEATLEALSALVTRIKLLHGAEQFQS